MATTAFARTFVRLSADRGGATMWRLLAVSLLLAAWSGWAGWSRVTVYAISTRARVEIAAATSPITAPLTGLVVRTNLQVGQTVRSGDALVEIDTVADRLQLQQEEIRVQGLDPEIARLRSQIEAETQARSEEQQASHVSAEEAAGRIREADTQAERAEHDLDRVEALGRQGLVPPRDLERARSEARSLRQAVSTFDAAARRVPRDQVTRDRERDVRIERLQADIAERHARRAALLAGITRLRYEIERRTVRAPVSGTIGEAALLRPGAIVREAEPLASIVPAGRLLVVAQFPADAAFGRIHPGQSATLRLDGYPWAEFGVVSATVASVAREIRDGMVRVELTIDSSDSGDSIDSGGSSRADDSGDSNVSNGLRKASGSGRSEQSFRGTLQHGMPGAVEVAVARATPLALVLQTAGQALTVGR